LCVLLRPGPSTDAFITHSAIFTLRRSFFGDLNLNIPQSAGTSFALGPMPTKGTMVLPFSGVLDGYGFRMERLLVDASTQQACNPASSTICNWKILFGGWSAGFMGRVTVSGALVTDTTPCADVAFRLDANVQLVVTSIYATGGVQ
jgi:hypothetical protein